MTTEPLSDPATPARWPKVVGTISIVWGGLGMLCTTCGGVMMLAPSVMINMVPEGDRAKVEQQMAANAPWPIEYVLIMIGGLLAILLLVAGIMLVRRNPGARPVHLVYSVVGLLVTLTNAGVQFVKVPAAVKASVPPGAGEGAIRQGVLVGYAFAFLFVLLGAAWPAFCLIWFAVVKRTNKDLGGGGSSAVV